MHAEYLTAWSHCGYKPSTVTKRTVVLRARLTPVEARNIRAMAKRAGMTSGAFVRRMAEVYARIEDDATAAADRAAREALEAPSEPGEIAA